MRSLVVRFAPTVHGAGDHGFMAVLVGIARDKGVSGYVDDGSEPLAGRAPPRRGAARAARRCSRAPAGSVVHAVAEEGVPTRVIAEAIGRGLGLPVESVPSEAAGDHFGWIGGFFAADAPASNTLTRELLGWQPTQPGLIEDLDQGHYFNQMAQSATGRN